MGSMSFKKRVSLILGLSMILGLVVPMFAAAGALAADVTSISGTVTFENPGSTESCMVILYDSNGDYVAEATTSRVDLGLGIILNFTGYGFYNLEPGNYKVAFKPPENSKYDTEYYDNKPDMASAGVITVDSATDTNPGIDAYLEVVNGGVKGTIKAVDTGAAVYGFYVQAYNAANGEKAGETWVWDDNKIGSDINYQLYLPIGEYKLLFDPRYPDDKLDSPYMSEWFNSKLNQAAANTITVSGTGVVRADVVLEKGGSISGTVMGEDGAAVEKCRVEARDKDGNFAACADTDASGNYKIQGLHDNSYSVRYTFNVANDKYLGEYYNDVRLLSEATLVPVKPAGDTPDINATLTGWGSLTGKVVKDEDGSSFEGVNVFVNDAATGEHISADVTASDGTFKVKYIPTGDYIVKFVPGNSDNDGHMLEWYDDKADGDDADPVHVTAFETTALAKVASLAPTGSISGTVVEEGTGTPIEGIKVDVVDPVKNETVRSKSTGVDGSYKIGRLPNGTYKVHFQGKQLADGSYYVAEWYNNKKTASEANEVTVSGTDDTPGVNGSLTIGGGSISGNVRSQDEAGNPPVEGCSVSAYDPTGGSGAIIAIGKTDEDGDYRIGGLPGGTYKVKFNPDAASIYRSEWYDNRFERDTANDVTVTDLADTPNINALLETTGKISGRVVSDEKGYPALEGAWVFLYDVKTGNQLSSHAVTDENGVYAIEGLDDGAYKVKFEPANQDPNEPEWYNNKATFNKADTINLKAPGVVTGVDAALTLQTTVGPQEIAANPVWYLPEGTTNWGFSTYFSIGNPNSTEVNVEVNYMTENGLVYGGAIYLPANSQATLNPDNAVPNQDFSTKIECREGEVITVDRTMTWTGPGAASGEGHCSTGVTNPGTSWYLPEGSTDWGFETWLLIQNPNDKEANCQVTYMIEGKGPQTFSKTVPANSRRTFNMADDIGAEDASIKVTSDIGIIPERAMYRNNRREGHDSIGTMTPQMNYYLAEGTTGWGFTTYILVQNPNDAPADVQITYMTSEGPRYHPLFTMPANSRQTIRVNDIMPGVDFSTQVSGSMPIIAERAMYWNNGTGEACHDSIGMSAPAEAFYLADGQTSVGRETWTLVQNPNDHDVVIQVTYMKPSGKNDPVFEDTIPANSRRTYNMADAGIQDRAAVRVVCLTSGSKIMVERAMYWNNRGAGTDSIGSYEN